MDGQETTKVSRRTLLAGAAFVGALVPYSRPRRPWPRKKRPKEWAHRPICRRHHGAAPQGARRRQRPAARLRSRLLRGRAAPQPLGSFGFNALGVADIDGTVREWTAICASRTTLDDNGAVLTTLPSCGVRYTEGRHPTQITAFIRDARAGGCSTGAPPDNLSFRLLREAGWLKRLLGL